MYINNRNSLSEVRMSDKNEVYVLIYVLYLTRYRLLLGLHYDLIPPDSDELPHITVTLCAQL